MNSVPMVPQFERDLLGHCLTENTAFLEAQQVARRLEILDSVPIA